MCFERKNMEKLKQCTCCKEFKELNRFGKRKSAKDGLTVMCKKCTGEYNKRQYKKNFEKRKEKDKEYYKKNFEKIKKYQEKYRKENSQKLKEYKKEYRKKNVEKIKKGNKRNYEKNIEKNKEMSRKWREKNKEKSKEYFRRYQKENSEKYNERQRIYRRERRSNDARFKLMCDTSAHIKYRLRSRLLSKNGKSTWSFLPYTVDELKQHLENLFEPWMNWNNYGRGRGRWNIDHIKPDYSFDYKSVDDEEFQKCWALSNLRPLDAIENIIKGNKIID